MTSFILLVITILITISRAQERSPHGIAYQSPLAISPEAYNFFHPDVQSQGARGPCASSKCSTLPVAATVQSTPAHENTATTEAGRNRLGGSGIATISIGVLSVVLVGIGVYQLVITRRNNAARAKAACQLKPDV